LHAVRAAPHGRRACGCVRGSRDAAHVASWKVDKCVSLACPLRKRAVLEPAPLCIVNSDQLDATRARTLWITRPGKGKISSSPARRIAAPV
jgi:hypothetical protein